jgi:hypothetical protein
MAGGFGEDPEYDVSKIQTIGGIYTYLSKVLIPAVSKQNMTLIDPACSADGGSSAECTWEAGSPGCCWQRPTGNPLFASAGNIMMTPVKLTQLRVRCPAAWRAGRGRRGAVPHLQFLSPAPPPQLLTATPLPPPPLPPFVLIGRAASFTPY